ncbi:hypothetical protein EVAR_97246_1 [Eumeta japonica]|uniref:Uncharacterized protein n=1 Tax=Eumeta variegata TaxID=151549 RepID=A0A4C1ZDC8_EUMVA|nr:hypothetical protein EVAR_97246_1 [Eumeta japonica]
MVRSIQKNIPLKSWYFKQVWKIRKNIYTKATCGLYWWWTAREPNFSTPDLGGKPGPMPGGMFRGRPNSHFTD